MEERNYKDGMKRVIVQWNSVKIILERGNFIVIAIASSSNVVREVVETMGKIHIGKIVFGRFLDCEDYEPFTTYVPSLSFMIKTRRNMT